MASFFLYENPLLHPSARAQETLLAQDGETVDAAIAPLEKALKRLLDLAGDDHMS